MVQFDSADIYIDSATTVKGKIKKIDAIIVVLEATALKTAANAHISGYSLDNGQTKINTTYYGVQQVLEAIKGFNSLREYYKAKLNGRVFRLVDSKSFNRNKNGF